MFGIDDALIGSLAGPLIGGLLGSGGSESRQSQQQQLDPRMQSLLYGDYTGGGILGDVNKLYKKQSANGGLNPLQTAGIEGQRQYLTNPNYNQGNNAMMNMGMSLLGGGVAGNPFTNGAMQGNRLAQPTQAPGPKYQQFNYDNNPAIQGAMSPMTFNTPAPAESPAAAPQETPDQAAARMWEEMRKSGRLAELLMP